MTQYLSPVKIENKKLFFVYNILGICTYNILVNIKNFILILNDIHKKNKVEKLIIKYYEKKLKPLVNINFS